MWNIQAESKIIEGTVYNDRAMITKISESDLEIGKYNITFIISFHIKEESLRASGAGSVEFKITGSGTKIIEHLNSPDIPSSNLQEKIQSMQDQHSKILPDAINH